MYHVRHRVYDPMPGAAGLRWLQRDPAFFVDGLNLYAYCGGDPVNGVDPLGLESWWVGSAARAIGADGLGEYLDDSVDGIVELSDMSDGTQRAEDERFVQQVEQLALVSLQERQRASGGYGLTDEQSRRHLQYVTLMAGTVDHLNEIRRYEYERGVDTAVNVGSIVVGYVGGQAVGKVVGVVGGKILATKLASRLAARGMTSVVGRTLLTPVSELASGRILTAAKGRAIAASVLIDAGVSRGAVVGVGECAGAGGAVVQGGIPTIRGNPPINSRYAGQTHPAGIEFTEKGFPNFRPVAVAEVQVPGLTGVYKSDAALANRMVGLDRTPDGYVWHHVEDGITMQLVPRAIHQEVRHTGGAAVIRNGGFDR